MLKHTLTLQIFELELAICRLPPTSPVPEWIGDKDFAISTYDTDYLLVKADRFDRALEILKLTCIIENRKEK